MVFFIIMLISANGSYLQAYSLFSLQLVGQKYKIGTFTFFTGELRARNLLKERRLMLSIRLMRNGG